MKVNRLTKSMDKKQSFAGHLQQGQILDDTNEIPSESLEMGEFEALQAQNIPIKVENHWIQVFSI